MASVNKVIILGNLGRDPEVRYTTNGAAICNLRIATTRNWKSRDSGDKMEETEWHSVVLYDRQAEIAGEYLKKGRPVYIEGRLKTRKWQDKEGVDRYTTEIVADSMQLLGGREGGDEAGGGGGGGGSYARSNRGGADGANRGADRGMDRGGDDPGDRGEPRSAPAAPAARPAPPPKPAAKSSTGFDDMDDDIPF